MSRPWRKKTGQNGRIRVEETVGKINIFGPVPVEASKKPKYKQRPKKK